MNYKTNINALDFLKIVFAILIVLFHSRMLTSYQENWIVINGRIGVEFFFIVSGCLMCASASKSTESNIGVDTFIFMQKKFCRLMPNVIVAYLIMFTLYHYNAGITDVSKLILNFAKSIPEFLLIKNSGIRFPSYNGPTWYLSAMLLNMLVIYPLIRKLKDSFYILALILMLFILGNFFQTYGTLSDLESWNGFILKGTIRGTAGLLAGCICYKISNFLCSVEYTRLGKASFMCLEWGCYLLSITLSCIYPPSRLDYFIFLLFMVGVTITYSNISYDSVVFRSWIFHWLGIFSFSLYLGHSAWREFTYNIYPKGFSFKELLVCYLVAATWSGLMVHYISEYIRDLKELYGNKIIRLFVMDKSC